MKAKSFKDLTNKKPYVKYTISSHAKESIEKRFPHIKTKQLAKELSLIIFNAKEMQSNKPEHRVFEYKNIRIVVSKETPIIVTIIDRSKQED